jgi:hypothetical protein
MKNKHFHISTISLIVILAAVIITAVLSLIFITGPVEVDNFLGPAELNPYPGGHDWLRRLLIYPGLILTISAIVIFLKSALSKNAAAADKILNYFILLAVICIGWLCTPYWANGLQYVFASGTSSMYDPKSLIPYTDIYVIWNGGVMLFFLLAFILILIPVASAVIDSIKNGFDLKYIYAAGFYLLIFAAFRLTPHYGYWFMD